MKKPQLILMDIEGTTTAIDFVHNTLFTYAKKNLKNYLTKNYARPHVRECLDQIKNIAGEEEKEISHLDEVINIIYEWIENDRKLAPLKTLQGYMWKDGYEARDFVSHIYEDVVPAWKDWKNQSIELGIYSSGSVAAQKMLFKYSLFGDLSSYINYYFDTSVGHKREVKSYKNISEELKIESQNILFVSDIVEELNAAVISGMVAAHIIRSGTQENNFNPSISCFSDLTW